MAKVVSIVNVDAETLLPVILLPLPIKESLMEVQRLVVINKKPIHSFLKRHRIAKTRPDFGPLKFQFALIACSIDTRNSLINKVRVPSHCNFCGG